MNARRAVRAGDLTSGQRAFLDHLLTSKLVESLYLSGGTALAAFHLTTGGARISTSSPAIPSTARSRVVGTLARSSI